MLQHHPDRQYRGLDGQRARAEQVNAAYSVLYDPVKRREYDEHLLVAKGGRGQLDQVLQAKDLGAAQRSAQINSQAISQTVSLSDFTTKSSDTEEVYYFPSRCGDEFRVGVQQLEDGDGGIVLACDGCTERIQVVYRVEEE